MPVNANSVISTSLQNYYPDAYTSVTDMENLCYTNSSRTNFSGAQAGITEYQPFFTAWNSAVVAWMQTNWESDLDEYIKSLYGYIVIGNNYGTGTSLLSSSDCYSVLSAGGVLKNLVGKPNTYYDDYTPGATQTDPGTAPTIQGDATTLQGAPSSDSALLSSRGQALRNGNAALTNRMLFENVPITGTPYTQQQLGVEIFTTLNFVQAYKYLNVGSLSLPGYIS